MESHPFGHRVALGQTSAATWWIFVALTLLFGALAVRHALKVQDDGGAIRRWQPQIQQLDETNIAAQFNYPNPPIMAVILEPFTLMSPLACAMSWYALKAAMAIVSFYWVFRLVESSEVPFPDWAKALTVAISLKPILDDLSHGNVNIFILFLVLGSLTAFRSRRDVLAGLLLALAIACKVTPALFVPYFIWKRQWRLLIACAVGLVLFFYPGLVPALRLGWDANQAQLFSWYDGMVRPFVIEGKVTSEHINQSLPGVAFRLLTENPSFVTWVNDIETPARYDNLLSLSTTQVKWLVKGCMGVFALLFVFLARTPTLSRHGWRLSAEMGMVLLGMLLFSERTWKHHAVTLMLPVGVVCYVLAACRSVAWVRHGLVVVLVAVGVLTLITGVGSGTDRATAAVHPGVAKLALVYGAYLWSWLALLAAMVVVLRLPRASSAAGRIYQTEPVSKAA